MKTLLGVVDYGDIKLLIFLTNHICKCNKLSTIMSYV